MTTCPPLPIDDALEEKLEAYRRAKQAAARAAGSRAAIDVAGHYDRDASTPRPVVEGEASNAERVAAIALADAVLGWFDRSGQ